MEESQPTARYWRKLDDDCIVCYLCPRGCITKEGQRGFCFVRQNINGEIVLTTYGRSSGFCIDPIEKKPLHHFYPGTGVLSFGTAGCNLGCVFCQNWNLTKTKDSDLSGELATPEMIAQAAKKFGCKSVAFTYNDPVIFTEYAMDAADACHKQGILTVAVTAGYIGKEARTDFFSRMDATNVDLKAFTDDFYRKMAQAKLQPVLDTLIYIKQKTKVWLEITNLLIPGENDSNEEIAQMCAWIVKELGTDVPLHFSAFHPDYNLTDHPATPTHTLIQAKSIALSKGIRYVYCGNVPGDKEASTYCHKCGKCLIVRNWYTLGEYHIKDGKCGFCQTLCAGHFENKPGDWGSKRQPISMK